MASQKLARRAASDAVRVGRGGPCRATMSSIMSGPSRARKRNAMQAGVRRHAVATACCIPCASLDCKQAPLLDGPPLAYGMNAGRDVKPSVSNISRSSFRSLLGVVNSLSPSKMLFAPAMKQSACRMSLRFENAAKVVVALGVEPRTCSV